MRSPALLALVVSLSTLAGGFLAGSLAQDKAEEPAGKKPPDAGARPRVVKERVAGDYIFPGEMVLRITGKVKVVDAGTVVFEDGTEVDVAGMMDAPALDQKGLIGETRSTRGGLGIEMVRNGWALSDH